MRRAPRGCEAVCVGKRSSSGMSKPCRKRRGEGYGACGHVGSRTSPAAQRVAWEKKPQRSERGLPPAAGRGIRSLRRRRPALRTKRIPRAEKKAPRRWRGAFVCFTFRSALSSRPRRTRPRRTPSSRDPCGRSCRQREQRRTAGRRRPAPSSTTCAARSPRG